MVIKYQKCNQPSCLTFFNNVEKLGRMSKISDHLPITENYIFLAIKNLLKNLTVFQKTE